MPTLRQQLTFLALGMSLVVLNVSAAVSDERKDLRRGSPATTEASKDAAQRTEQVIVPDIKSSLPEKKQWVKKQIIDPLSNPRQRSIATVRLQRMSNRQTNMLLAYYRDLLLLQNAGQLSPAALASTQRRLRLQQRRMVGFAPVITWLPSGTNMNAGAIVSPDRRSARLTMNPVFSSVPYFDTFNMSNGNTRRYYVDKPPPETPSQPPARPVPDWYKRIRTIR